MGEIFPSYCPSNIFYICDIWSLAHLLVCLRVDCYCCMYPCCILGSISSVHPSPHWDDYISLPRDILTLYPSCCLILTLLLSTEIVYINCCSNSTNADLLPHLYSPFSIFCKKFAYCINMLCSDKNSALYASFFSTSSLVFYSFINFITHYYF